MTHLALFDYGAGNLHSLAKGLEAGGAQVTVTRSIPEALRRDALILPGVGSFGAAVRALEGERERIREALGAGLPCLGICLGMQLLLDASEEGEGEGIGLIPGQVRRLSAQRIPQMGWNDVDPTSNPDPIFPRFAEGGRTFSAYYANSYVCAPEDPSVVVAHSTYEADRFPAALRWGNTRGVQFHPEKSSVAGLALLRNFVELVRAGAEGEAR